MGGARRERCEAWMRARTSRGSEVVDGRRDARLAGTGVGGARGRGARGDARRARGRDRTRSRVVRCRGIASMTRGGRVNGWGARGWGGGDARARTRD